MVDVKKDVSLSPLTTFGIGGSAEQFLHVGSEEELVEALLYARDNNLPVTILGGGSNVLVPDEGVRGLVVQIAITGRNFELSEDGVVLKVGAGEVFDEVVKETVQRGYWGLENLSLIPGLIGATPIQNVGAYGVEVSDMIRDVTTIDSRTGEKKVFDNKECRFAYRDSFFKTAEGRNYIVTSVTFRLSTKTNPQLGYKDLQASFKDNDRPTQAEIREAVISVRSDKFPNWHELGTAGSFFKNPIVTKKEAEVLLGTYPNWPHFLDGSGGVKLSLSWFLDNVLGLKGMREGAVGTYEKHVLVMINYGGASAIEVETFAKKISEAVFLKTKIRIEWEVTKLS